jgi:murein DD-endopeptidase MepM/ murein hydrolase activator NlpD
MNAQNLKEQSDPLLKDILSYIVSFFQYLYLRLRIFLVYLWAFFIFLIGSIDYIKDELVKRMFWGRSAFYRSAFQFSVGVLTFIIGIFGLAGRLNIFAPQTPEVLAFPTEQLGDADYLDEGASIQAIVTNASLGNQYQTQKYIVQRGDSLGSIADKFGISTDTIRWANGITGDYIKVGQELEILPIPGVLHTVKAGDTLDSIAQKYEASVQDIYDINWLDSSILKDGQELLVPNGRMPQPKPVVQPKPTVYTPPPTVTPGAIVGSGNFIRPCGCGNVTNRFSAWHQGVDIAYGGGCPTVAADAGVVTMARWYGAGGLQVMINHGNGWVSLYAHHSVLYVSEGQTVTRGQPIGYMGSTGRSSGVHLHFGVSYNGVWVNPLAYVPI